MLPVSVSGRVDEYLARVDAVLPGVVTSAYVVGSIALDSYKPGRSDIDMVLVARELTDDELTALARAQRRLYVASLARALRQFPSAWPLVCNVVYVRTDDLARPAPTVTPICSHVSAHFTRGSGFDVNPVTWRILGTHGIAVRGPAATTLGVYDDDTELRRWTADNLASYWLPWAGSIRHRSLIAARAIGQQWSLAWGVFGVARMHCTIATGAVVSKEAAGLYARETFDARWHPLVDAALRYWRGEGGGPYRPTPRPRAEIADFVDEVAEDARARVP